MSNESVVTASSASRSLIGRSLCIAVEQVGERAVGDLNPFGLAGRSRGVDDIGEVRRGRFAVEVRAALARRLTARSDRGRGRAPCIPAVRRNRFSSVRRTEACASSSMKASRSAG